MAGHIQDRWYKSEPGPDGKPRRVRTARYGTGMRYRARYVAPDGTERSKSFPDRQKRQAEDWLARIESDMSQGHYIDPKVAKETFRSFAERWLAGQATDVNTRSTNARHLRLHAFPHIGLRPIGSFKPGHIRDWLAELERTGMTGGYRRNIFSTVRAVLSAAVDEGVLPRNPCKSRSVSAPKPTPARVVPWTAERVFAVRAALPAEFQAMVDLGAGCGLRQGEIIGFALDAADLHEGMVRVVRQVKMVNGHAVFAPPKGGKLRDVPLPEAVASRLQAHMDDFPPVPVTLPWLQPNGPKVTHRLLFSNSSDGVAYRANFNIFTWKPALAAAGVIATPEEGESHEAAREHGMHALRHFYASVLLDAGESIKALSTYLGHSDPGFTLRTYTHLMPSSEARTKRAVDAVYGDPEPISEQSDGPETTQAA